MHVLLVMDVGDSSSYASCYLEPCLERERVWRRCRRRPWFCCFRIKRNVVRQRKRTILRLGKKENRSKIRIKPDLRNLNPNPIWSIIFEQVLTYSSLDIRYYPNQSKSKQIFKNIRKFGNSYLNLKSERNKYSNLNEYPK